MFTTACLWQICPRCMSQFGMIYFLAFKDLRASTTFRDRFLYYRGYQYANFILFFNQKINKIKKINLLKKSKFDRFLFYLASFRTLKIVLFIAHIMVSVLENKEKTCYWWFHMVNIYQFWGVDFLIWIKYLCNI